MTNKQIIIIDGVTVSRCCYYNEGKCLGCFVLDKNDCISCYGICKKINDCYYKNWKRKEQELEQYKKSKQASYETMQKEWNEAKNEVKKLKAENKKLRERLYIQTKEKVKYIFELNQLKTELEQMITKWKNKTET